MMEYKTIWCKMLETGYFVLIRTRPADTADRLVQEYNECCDSHKQYFAFDPAFNPNERA